MQKAEEQVGNHNKGKNSRLRYVAVLGSIRLQWEWGGGVTPVLLKDLKVRVAILETCYLLLRNLEKDRREQKLLES
jgi:hypothetical protein